ncbi:MAG: CPBP family intramembrane metalloprotease [Roseburia sp.]|nr:CPBP family intramembrane metalloprotease [Roseburia sp.]
MKDFIDKPLPVAEAAEKQKGLNWFLEILVFVLVFVVSFFALVIVVLPGELVMFSTNQVYQEAVASGNASEIVAASNQIAQTDAYMILSLFADIAMIVVVCLFCKLIQKRGLRTMGFRREHAGREYLIGALAGFLFFSAAVLLGVLTGGLKITGISSQFSIGIFILYLLGYMIQGMAEEVLCRGYLMVSIGRRYPMYAAVLTNALFFAALHLMNDGITVLAFINLALFGIFASMYFIRRGNIWGIGAFHSIWNLVQGNFYGIRVSGMPMGNSLFETVSQEGKDLLNGGAFGMEGSIWVTVVLAVGIVFLYIRKNQGKEEAAA